MGYAIEHLGYLQFQQVCAALLELDAGVDPLLWEGDADDVRSAVSWTTPPSPPLPTPVLVQCIWFREPVTGVDDAALQLESRVGSGFFQETAGQEEIRSLLLVSNVELDDALPGAVSEAFAAQALATQVIGPDALGERFDARAELRLRFPSLLGLREGGPRIDAVITERSQFDRRAAEALARVFVPTNAYHLTREVLAQHHFAVLTGPPEMGKTANARMLGLALMTDGWEAHECTAPEQLFAAFDPAARQVFIADDAFGSTEYRPDASERWAREMERILRSLDDHHWLIWTSRPAPLRAGLDRIHRERGAERFPASGEVLIDASRLDAEEKTLILFRHAKAAGLSEEHNGLLRASGASIVAHRHFTPERIRRLVGRLAAEPITALAELAEAELSRASEAMVTSFTALRAEQRSLLIAMLDTQAGPTDERAVSAALRRHHPGGLPRRPTELVDRLTDHFVRVEDRQISWVHPSWRDLVIEQLRADDEQRQRFLGCCSIHGVLLALSVGGGATGERDLPLLVTDADWDALGDRVHGLIPELAPGELQALLEGVRQAHDAGDTSGARGEVAAFARAVLARSASLWDSARRPIPLPDLEAWLAMAGALGESVTPPSLSLTWAELLPARSPTLDDREATQRLADWVTLAELVAAFDEALLHGLGFPGPGASHVTGYLDLVVHRPDESEPADIALTHELVLASLRLGLGDAEALERLRTWTTMKVGEPLFDLDEADPTARVDLLDAVPFDVRRVLKDL